MINEDAALELIKLNLQHQKSLLEQIQMTNKSCDIFMALEGVTQAIESVQKQQNFNGAIDLLIA